jgi:hypothetical protein
VVKEMPEQVMAAVEVAAMVLLRLERVLLERLE